MIYLVRTLADTTCQPASYGYSELRWTRTDSEVYLRMREA